jgi:vacuolar-type H+-ATPase subunit D/Vma8
MITPNKQNLLLLKKQLKVVASGLKLLKEKRTGLVSLFIKLAQQGKNLENRVGHKQQNILGSYSEAVSFVSVSGLIDNLSKNAKFDLQVEKKRISGVYLENFKISISAPFRLELKTNISSSLAEFSSIFPDLLMIVQLKLNVEKIAKEIEKTNRLINNLEKKTEEVIAQIKFINTALSEKESLEKATLIKIFG